MQKWFLYSARLEGLSFLLLLFVGMPLKYFAAMPEGVRVLGPVHGGLFLIYCALVFFIGSAQEWSAKKYCAALIASVLPFGTFVFEKKYLQQRNLIPQG